MDYWGFGGSWMINDEETWKKGNRWMMDDE